MIRYRDRPSTWIGCDLGLGISPDIWFDQRLKLHPLMTGLNDYLLLGLLAGRLGNCWVYLFWL
jgi:hypothetical protein